MSKLKQYTLKELEQHLAVGEDDEEAMDTRQDVVEHLDRVILCATVRAAEPRWVRDESKRWVRRLPAGVELVQRKFGGKDIERLHVTDAAEATVTLTMPLKAARLLARCARDGMRKGQQRRGVSLERTELKRRRNVYLWAKEIKAEIKEAIKNKTRPKTSTADIHQEAAVQARALGSERYDLNIAVSTIKRALGWRE